MLKIGEQIWYTTQEVADRLQVKKQSVYNWVRIGRLKSGLQAGKTRLFESAEIDAFAQLARIGRRIVTSAEKSLLQQNDAEMARLFREGKTLEEIGIQFKISRERVRQRLQRQGIRGKQGGISLRAKSRGVLRAKALQAHREKQCLKKWGISCEELLQLRACLVPLQMTKIQKIYLSLRHKSLREHSQWAINIAEFATMIQPYVEKYGRSQYVVFLKDKTRPYTIDNLEVITHRQSSQRTRNRKLVDDFLKANPEYDVNPSLIAGLLGMKKVTVSTIIRQIKNERNFAVPPENND